MLYLQHVPTNGGSSIEDQQKPNNFRNTDVYYTTTRSTRETNHLMGLADDFIFKTHCDFTRRFVPCRRRHLLRYY